jgi:hypothetical protein
MELVKDVIYTEYLFISEMEEGAPVTISVGGCKERWYEKWGDTRDLDRRIEEALKELLDIPPVELVSKEFLTYAWDSSNEVYKVTFKLF